MTEHLTTSGNWQSYTQLVHQLITGLIRRHTFTKWELDLLLDAQTIRMRKASRPEIFRRYLRAVEQAHAAGQPAPPRFALFFQSEIQTRRPVIAPLAFELPRAS